MKFGGRQPTGTPSLALSTVVVVASLLAGASVVHNIYKPDLVSHLVVSYVFDKMPQLVFSEENIVDPYDIVFVCYNR
ncbi:hypothetical protein MKW92_030368 [Papaver armeniacum]|nr:hypothetical protein MKW92_030368 [Papaver armeniacum]